MKPAKPFAMPKKIKVTPENIKLARAALDETQGKFAARLGVEQCTLSRWEAGKLPEHGTAALLIERVLNDIAQFYPASALAKTPR